MTRDEFNKKLTKVEEKRYYESQAANAIMLVAEILFDVKEELAKMNTVSDNAAAFLLGKNGL